MLNASLSLPYHLESHLIQFHLINLLVSRVSLQRDLHEKSSRSFLRVPYDTTKGARIDRMCIGLVKTSKKPTFLSVSPLSTAQKPAVDSFHHLVKNHPRLPQVRIPSNDVSCGIDTDGVDMLKSVDQITSRVQLPASMNNLD